MKKINIFNLSILGYLYLPIVLFLITWLNPIIGLPLVLVICYIVLRYSFQKSEMNMCNKLGIAKVELDKDVHRQ